MKHTFLLEYDDLDATLSEVVDNLHDLLYSGVHDIRERVELDPGASIRRVSTPYLPEPDESMRETWRIMQGSQLGNPVPVAKNFAEQRFAIAAAWGMYVHFPAFVSPVSPLLVESEGLTR